MSRTDSARPRPRLVSHGADVVMVIVRELRLPLGPLVVLFMTAETWRYVGRLTGPRLGAVVLTSLRNR